jgi:hypothetical protein
MLSDTPYRIASQLVACFVYPVGHHNPSPIVGHYRRTTNGIKYGGEVLLGPSRHSGTFRHAECEDKKQDAHNTIHLEFHHWASTHVTFREPDEFRSHDLTHERGTVRPSHHFQ